jgi:FkbM family methyltransferase
MSLSKIESVGRILLNIFKFKKEFLILLKLFISKKIFFVKIGASEANIRNDVLAKFINVFNCQGVLIEPHLIHFNRLKKKYSEKFTCLNLAISNKNGSRNLFTVNKGYLNSLSTLEQQSLLRKSSFYKEHVIAAIIKRGVDKKKFLKKIIIKTLDINSLLNKYKNTNLLFMDCEGHDYIILKKLNLKKFKIKTIIFENRHLSQISLKDKLKKIKFLDKKFKKYNYKLLFRNLNESIYQLK